MKKHECPDRCDMEMPYGWDRTNLWLNVITSDPQYLLKAGEEVSISLRYVKPEKVKILFNDESLELESDGEGAWLGTIPDSWTSQGSFQVVLERGSCKMFLYAGLMNSLSEDSTCSLDGSIYGLTDDFIQTSSKGLTVTRDSDGFFHVDVSDDLIESSDGTVNVEEADGSYDLGVAATQPGKDGGKYVYIDTKIGE